jgi:glycosyltransferase involved in cell wall biosynthesis
MNITVILCTYNRSESLQRALHSIAQSTLPPSIDWEVLVVDNNSNDHTRDVFEDFNSRYPARFRYLFEPKAGKSHALNSGIVEARGDVLAFMDDDVEVEPAWLQNLTSALGGSSCAGVGGRILPQWTGPQPGWLPTGERYGLAPLAMFDLGLEPGPLTEAPFGTNMAFQRAVFERYGGFRTDLGPRPGSEIRNEDTEFGQRLLNAGERLLYEPSAVVYHEVSENRLTRAYFLRWFFDKARAEVREFGIPQHSQWTMAGVPLHLFRRLAVWSFRWLATSDANRRFASKLKVWGRVGEIKECYRMSREKQGLSR